MNRTMITRIAAAFGLAVLMGCAGAGDDTDASGVYDFTFSTDSPRVGQQVTMAVDFRGDLANGIYFMVERTTVNGEFKFVSSDSVFGTASIAIHFPLHGTYRISMRQALSSSTDTVVKTIIVPEPADAGYAALCELPGVWRLTVEDDDGDIGIYDDHMIAGLRETVAGNEDWGLDLYAYDNDRFYDLIIYGEADAVPIGRAWYALGACHMSIYRDSSTYYHVDFTTSVVGDSMEMIPGTTAEVLNTIGDTSVKDAVFNYGVMNMVYLPR